MAKQYESSMKFSKNSNDLSIISRLIYISKEWSLEERWIEVQNALTHHIWRVYHWTYLIALWNADLFAFTISKRYFGLMTDRLFHHGGGLLRWVALGLLHFFNIDVAFLWLNLIENFYALNMTNKYVISKRSRLEIYDSHICIYLQSFFRKLPTENVNTFFLNICSNSNLLYFIDATYL